MAKRYYWLKLKEGFFDDKYIKALRKLPDGDRVIIVYLRMQLLSLKTEGIIGYSKIMPSCAEELALSLDEDTNIVSLTLQALERMGLVEVWDDQTIYMTAMQELIGAESDSAERVRQHRERKALQCNASMLLSNSQVTQGNTEKENKRERKKKDTDTPPPPSDDKCQYAEYVSMTAAEHESLVSAHGEAATARMVEILDNYKGANGKRYKSDYRAILNWVVTRYKEEQARGGGKAAKAPSDYKGDSFV